MPATEYTPTEHEIIAQSPQWTVIDLVINGVRCRYRVYSQVYKSDEVRVGFKHGRAGEQPGHKALALLKILRSGQELQGGITFHYLMPSKAA
jgi:hypothetical protein